MAEDLTVRAAGKADGGELLALARAFWAEDGFPSTPAQEAALVELFSRPEWGLVYAIELAGRIVGYAVVAWGFSLEFGGRDGFLDELFLMEEARNRGLGARAMDLIAEDVRARGLKALHLELMDDNGLARPFYRRVGFEERQSRMMSWRL